jgi:SAM-dependent methyltransferase
MKREEWNQRYSGTELVWTVTPNRFLVAEVEGLAPARALDLACGAGRNALWLAERGWTVLGADFSDVALENARGLAAERGVEVEWVQADLREWEPPARSFDLVIVLYLQVPGDDLRSALRNAAEAVAPGGTILVVGHHLENLQNGYGGPSNPAVLYTPEQVVDALDGLEVEKADRVLRPVEGERDAIDALVRACRTRRPGR